MTKQGGVWPRYLPGVPKRTLNLREYIAVDVVHRYGDEIDAALITKLRQNARRNFGVTLSFEEVESLARLPALASLVRIRDPLLW